LYAHALAAKNDVRIDFNCADLSDCGVPEADLNIILGNAIENAIEASANIPEEERYIKVCAKLKPKQLFITVDNAFDGVIKTSEEGMLSRKRGFSKEGYGTASMKSVVDKYKGIYKHEVKDNRYLLSIMLRIK